MGYLYGMDASNKPALAPVGTSEQVGMMQEGASTALDASSELAGPKSKTQVYAAAEWGRGILSRTCDYHEIAEALATNLRLKAIYLKIWMTNTPSHSFHTCFKIRRSRSSQHEHNIEGNTANSRTSSHWRQSSGSQTSGDSGNDVG